MDGNLNRYAKTADCISKCGFAQDLHVRTVHAEKDAPDIRECIALFLLERKYGLDDKLQKIN